MDKISSDFVEHYSQSRVWFQDVKWMGVSCQKLPLDLWVYQEILFEKRPQLIVDCGTNAGGTALFLAQICDAIGSGVVVTIDCNHRRDFPVHPRIFYQTGDTTSRESFESVGKNQSPAMVILDSNHEKGHVLKEMRLWSDLVTVGQYMVVEDGFINGHPSWPEHGPGPTEAIEEFLRTDERFIVDDNMEKFGATFNQSGYLLKVS